MGVGVGDPQFGAGRLRCLWISVALGVVLWSQGGVGVGAQHAGHTGFARYSSHRQNVITTMADTSLATATTPNNSTGGKSSGTVLFDLKKLGAKGDGVTDDTQVRCSLNDLFSMKLPAYIVSE